MCMKIIKLNNLSKSFDREVLNNINYNFYYNKVYLIIGENGSGKSTLIKLILNVFKPSSGYVEKSTNYISYVPDNLIFPEFITIEKFLIQIMKISKLENIHLLNYYLNRYGLDGKKKLNSLSKGMRQKVLIIQALIKDASIYIFDEPLNGLDKQMQLIFLEDLTKLKKRGKTLIIVSHQIDCFKDLSNYILDINNGEVNERFN